MFDQLRKFDCLIGKAAYFIFSFFGTRPVKESRILAPEVKKILCIKLWGLGNLAIIYPLLYRIKAKLPQARLSFLTFDLNKGFLERNQAVDKVVYFKFTKNPLLIAWRVICSLISLRKERFDLLINFETFNHASGLFSYLSASSARIGLYAKYEKIFYNYPRYHDRSKHISQVFLSLLEPLGLEAGYSYFDYQGAREEKEKVESLLICLKLRQFVCFHIGTSDNYRGKRYKANNFVKLADLLIGKYDLPVVLTGTAKEKELSREIIEMASFKNKIIDLSGKLTMWEFVELLRKTTLFVSGDTGPVHFAASLGVNLAVFYGPSSPQRYGPLNANSLVFHKNKNCGPCVGAGYVNKKCPKNFACMDFSPQEVFSRIPERFFYAEKN